MPLERQPPPIADAISDGIGLTPMVKLSHPSKGYLFYFIFFSFFVNTSFFFTLMTRSFNSTCNSSIIR